jgi:hypothetical protein
MMPTLIRGPRVRHVGPDNCGVTEVFIENKLRWFQTDRALVGVRANASDEHIRQRYTLALQILESPCQ